MYFYIIPQGPYKGQKLAIGTVIKYVSAIINSSRKLFLKEKNEDSKHLTKEERDDIEEFFTCLLPRSVTESGIWWSKLKLQTVRNVFQETVKSEKIKKEDNSQPPLYVKDVSECIRMYMLSGTKEGSQRALTLLASLQMAGRTGEAAWVTLDNINYDTLFKGCFGNAPQSKTSKMKVSFNIKFLHITKVHNLLTLFF